MRHASALGDGRAYVRIAFGHAFGVGPARGHERGEDLPGELVAYSRQGARGETGAHRNLVEEFA